MRCGANALSNFIAESRFLNSSTRCTSSAVDSSIPAMGIIEYLSHALKNEGQLAQLLWSVSAMAESPLRYPIPAILNGVMSSDAQGERHECM